MYVEFLDTADGCGYGDGFVDEEPEHCGWDSSFSTLSTSAAPAASDPWCCAPHVEDVFELFHDEHIPVYCQQIGVRHQVVALMEVTCLDRYRRENRG
jgi:hypothetical protein